jgi:predicted transcriptional regulator
MTGNTAEVDPESNASRHDQRTEQLPETLQSARTKLVYLYLETVEKAQVGELQRALDMQALSLYPILEILVDHKLVERADDGYVIATDHVE